MCAFSCEYIIAMHVIKMDRYNTAGGFRVWDNAGFILSCRLQLCRSEDDFTSLHSHTRNASGDQWQSDISITRGSARVGSWIQVNWERCRSDKIRFLERCWAARVAFRVMLLPLSGVPLRLQKSTLHHAASGRKYETSIITLILMRTLTLGHSSSSYRFIFH